MKKNFLFKGVSVLGAMLLLASAVLPGINAYAYSDNTWTWDYVSDETSWNASYENGALKVYYANNPSEDVWNVSENRACNFNDKIYTAKVYTDAAGEGEYVEKQFAAFWLSEEVQRITEIGGEGNVYYIPMFYDVPEQLYEMFCNAPGGAVAKAADLADSSSHYIKIESMAFGGEGVGHAYNAWIANGAQAPWISIAFKQEFKGTIKFNYEDYENGVDVYPRGKQTRTWGPDGKAWAEASIPGEFGNTYNTTNFDLSKFTATLVSAIDASENSIKAGKYIAEKDENNGRENRNLDGTKFSVSNSYDSDSKTITVTITDNGLEAYKGGNDLNNDKKWISLIADFKTTVNGTETCTDESCPENYVRYGIDQVDRDDADIYDGDTTSSTDFIIWINVEDKNGKTIRFVNPADDYVNVKFVVKETVTWDIEGTTTTSEVVYGEAPTYEGTPTKSADSSYTYSFKGWSKDGTNVVTLANETVTDAVTYKALFNSTARSSSSGGGGGSSRSSSKTTTTDNTKKAEDTSKTDETKSDESKSDETKADESKTSEEAKAAADAQALKDGYSQEFIDAYNFARENNITTKDTIREADMDAPLTRIAMAKMLSQYAINLLGKTPDTSVVVPTFPDVSAQLDADYNNGVTLAYQLGIMGIGIEEFRPFAEVTRAEFGTALSRMLFGLADGEGAEWYKTHLDKLMNEQIITNDNPNLKELRGYVMIMLMRSAQ